MGEFMTVSYTPDGDTLRLRRLAGLGEVRVRLAWIDAPELGHPASYRYAVSARAYLRRLLYIGEMVEVRSIGMDRYSRIVAEVLRVRDAGNCSLRLVYGGYAALWRCPPEQVDYYDAQAMAQQKQRGIWANPGPWQTPWQHREHTP